jgi:hypothetical protein
MVIALAKNKKARVINSRRLFYLLIKALHLSGLHGRDVLGQRRNFLFRNKMHDAFHGC